MVKNTTLAEFQAAEIEPIREPSPLAQLAERMVRERSNDQPTDAEITAQLQGLGIIDEIDAHMALGEIKSRVWSAADAASIPATAEQIDAEAERIWTFYGDTRRASEAHYSVGPHDLEVFRAEVEIYGLWAPELQEVAPAFAKASQPSLFDAPSGEIFERTDLEPVMGDEYGVLGDDPAEPKADDPMSCSVCGALFDLDEFTTEDIAQMRANPAVVLCEACGEDGILDDGLDGEAAG